MFGNGKVFVSHTHEDNATCASALAALDAWQVNYWFDMAQLSAGQELFDRIQRALQDRDIFLRICAPAANLSTWMTQEQNLARSLRSPNGGQRRMINLIVKPGYVALAGEENDIAIDATHRSQIEWLRQLREALGVPSRERHVSRRAVFGLGVTSLAALGAMGYAGRLFLSRPSAISFQPVGHQPTPTPLPGASRIRWTYTADSQALGGVLSVAVAGETVMCSSHSSQFVTSLTAADGALRWQQQYFDLNAAVPSTVAGDTIYLTSQEGAIDSQGANVQNSYLVALNAPDGSERWKTLVVSDANTSANAQYVTSAVTVVGAIACLRYNQAVYAFDATSGKPLWSQSAGQPPTDPDAILPAPTISANAVYAVLGDQKLHAFSLTDGSPLWPAPFAADFPIRAQPVAADGVVYSGADGGFCYALAAATGEAHWKKQLLKNPTATFTVLGLTLSSGVLYVSGGFPLPDFSIHPTLHGTAIQALDAVTGKILWSSSPDEQLKRTDLQSDLLRANPLVVGAAIFVATRMQAQNGRNVNILFALNQKTGAINWTFQMWGGPDVSGPGPFPSAPIVAGDTLYIASGAETVYAISYAD